MDAARILEKQLDEIAERFVDFESDAAEAGYELGETGLLAELDSLIADESEMVASALALIDRREALEDAHRKAARRATARAAIEAKLVTLLKEMLCRYVDSRGGKVEGPGFRAWTQPNTPRVEVESSVDPHSLAEDFTRTEVREPEVTVDREKVLAAWKIGAELPQGIKVVWGRHLRRR